MTYIIYIFIYISQDRQNGTGRTGQTKRDIQNRKDRIGEAEWDRPNGTGRTGHSERER
jgi:hypothetical protein